MKRINALREIVADYQNLLLDQFGVLHDGTRVYPMVNESLRQLKSLRKKIVCVSNSGKTSAGNLKRIANIGMNPSIFDLFISSGQALNLLLINPEKYGYKLPGKKVLIISRGGDRSFLENVGISVSEKIEDADFIILSGISDNAAEGILTSSDFQYALTNNIPVICANPDKLMILEDKVLPGAGYVSMKFEESGGKVTYIGKPYQMIYDIVLSEIRNDGKCLAVGDSIEHDIIGGKRIGSDTLFICDGIHAEETRPLNDGELQSFIMKLCDELQCEPPDYYLSKFIY